MSAAAGRAEAQAADPNAASDPPGVRPAGQLEELVVTARRREESLQSVPVAASVFNETALAARAITNISDFTTKIPSLKVSQSGSSNSATVINIRGQEGSNISAAFDPGVAVYFDEVYFGRSTGNILSSLQDLEAVEVLRGVQGTLFGRNSNGGAIVIRPVRPVLDRFEGSADLSYGSHNRTEVRGVLNIPVVTDKLAIRASGNWLWRDGFQPSTTTGIKYGDRNRGGGRIGVRATPTDQITLDFTYDISRLSETGFLISRPLDPNFLEQTTAGIREPHSSSTVHGYTGRAVFDAGKTQIKTIIAYRDIHSRDIEDVDGGPSTSLDFREDFFQHQFSAELNIHSTLYEGDGWLNTLDLTTGLFYFKEKGEEPREIPYTATVASGTLISGLARNNSRAIYGQLEADMFDHLAVFGGIRYTRDNRFYSTGTIVNGLCATIVRPVTDCFISNNASFGYVSYTAGARYNVSSAAQLYAKVSKGERSGGLDNNTVQVFRPEIVTEYELGAKADWFERRLRTNFAAFKADFTDIQRTGIVLINGISRSSITNAAAATIKGVEFEGAAIPVSGLTLSATFGYLDARYDSFLRRNPNGTVSDLTNNKFNNVAKYTYSVAADYTWRMASGVATANADWGWRSRTYFEVENDPFLVQPAYGLLNARLSYSPDGGLWGLRSVEFSLFGKNLTDRHYLQSGTRFGPNGNVAVFPTGEPRTVGAAVGVRF